jgi:hypothetical protein
MVRFRPRIAFAFLISLHLGCARKAKPPGKPDLKPPYLQILYPTESDTLSGSVRVEVHVEDQSSLRFVRLLIDGDPVASDSTDPYELHWDTSTLVDTFHTVVVQSTDRWDNTGKSAPVSIFTQNGNEPEKPEENDLEERPKPEPHEEPEAE